MHHSCPEATNRRELRPFGQSKVGTADAFGPSQPRRRPPRVVGPLGDDSRSRMPAIPSDTALPSAFGGNGLSFKHTSTSGPRTGPRRLTPRLRQVTSQRAILTVWPAATTKTDRPIFPTRRIVEADLLGRVGPRPRSGAALRSSRLCGQARAWLGSSAVEQRIHSPPVGGSSPPPATKPAVAAVQRAYGLL